jgi:hypothetical protein
LRRYGLFPFAIVTQLGSPNFAVLSELVMKVAPS